MVVKDAKVTLEGSVPDRRMKHAIEDLADQCPGVQDVDNRIRVQAGRDTNHCVIESTTFRRQGPQGVTSRGTSSLESPAWQSCARRGFCCRFASGATEIDGGELHRAPILRDRASCDLHATIREQFRELHIR